MKISFLGSPKLKKVFFYKKSVCMSVDSAREKTTESIYTEFARNQSTRPIKIDERNGL